MILDTDIIPFSTNSYQVYKSGDKYFMVNGEHDLLLEHKPLNESCSDKDIQKVQDDYEQLEEEFSIYYQENQASCHHFIGEFRLDSKNYPPFVGSFYGFEYFTEEQILTAVSKLIRCVETQSDEGFEEYQLRIATLYNLDTLENLEPYKYQEHEYSQEELENN